MTLDPQGRNHHGSQPGAGKALGEREFQDLYQLGLVHQFSRNTTRQTVAIDFDPGTGLQRHLLRQTLAAAADAVHDHDIFGRGVQTDATEVDR